MNIGKLKISWSYNGRNYKATLLRETIRFVLGDERWAYWHIDTESKPRVVFEICGSINKGNNPTTDKLAIYVYMVGVSYRAVDRVAQIKDFSIDEIVEWKPMVRYCPVCGEADIEQLEDRPTNLFHCKCCQSLFYTSIHD